MEQDRARRKEKPKKSRSRRIAGHVARTCIVLVVLVGLFVYGNMAVGYEGKPINEGVWESFYDEERDSVDVMYYGSSASSRFFNNVYAYHETGIVSCQIGIASTPAYLIDDIMAYSRKTQHPKLSIVELRAYMKNPKKIDEDDLRRVVDSMRFLDTGRVPLYREGISYLKKYQKQNLVDRRLRDYLFPLIAYSERLTDGSLTADDLLLKREQNPYKGFCLGSANVSQAPQTKPRYETGKAELTTYQKETLDKLLDYCQTIDGDVLFVMSPRKTTPKESLLANAICAYVEERGFDCLNFNTDEMVDKLGLDWSTDFYNRNHTNYLGSEKFTKWLAGYLLDHYDLQDHRGDSAYQSWEDGYASYEDFVAGGIQYKGKTGDEE